MSHLAAAAAAAPPNDYLYGLKFDKAEYPTVKHTNNYIVYKDTRCNDLKSCLQNRHISVPKKACDDNDENMVSHKTVHSNTESVRTYYFPTVLPNDAECLNNTKYISLIDDTRKLCLKGTCRLERRTPLPSVYTQTKDILNKLSEIESNLSFYNSKNTSRREQIINNLNYFSPPITDVLCGQANQQIDPQGFKRTNFRMILKGYTLDFPPMKVIPIEMEFKQIIGDFLIRSYEFLSHFVSHLIEKEINIGSQKIISPVNISDENIRIRKIISIPFDVKSSVRQTVASGFNVLQVDSPKGEESPKPESPNAQLVESLSDFSIDRGKKSLKKATKPDLSEEQKAIKDSMKLQQEEKKLIKNELIEYCELKINYRTLHLLIIGDIIEQDYLSLFNMIVTINKVLEFRITITKSELQIFQQAIEVIKIVQIFKSKLLNEKKIEMIFNLNAESLEYIEDLQSLEYKEYIVKLSSIIYDEHFGGNKLEGIIDNKEIIDTHKFKLHLSQDLLIIQKLVDIPRTSKIYRDILFLIYSSIHYNFLDIYQKSIRILSSKSHELIQKLAAYNKIVKINLTLMQLKHMFNNISTIQYIDSEIQTSTKDLSDTIEKLNKDLRTHTHNLFTTQNKLDETTIALQNSDDPTQTAKLNKIITLSNSIITKKREEITAINNEISELNHQFNIITNEIHNKYYDNIYIIDSFIDYYVNFALDITSYVLPFNDIEGDLDELELNTICLLNYNIFDIIEVRMNITRSELKKKIENTHFEYEEKQTDFETYSENIKIYLLNDENYDVFIHKLRTKYNNMFSCYFTLLEKLSSFILSINNPNTNFCIFNFYIHHHNIHRIELFKQHCDYKLLNDKLDLFLKINNIIYQDLFQEIIENMPYSCTINNILETPVFIQKIRNIKELLKNTSDTLFNIENEEEEAFLNRYYEDCFNYRANILHNVNIFLDKSK